jgi:hypothetical protein
MSLQYEQYAALRRTREFLFDLLDPRATPRVPKSVRKEASNCLHHFPYLHASGEPMWSQGSFKPPARPKNSKE